MTISPTPADVGRAVIYDPGYVGAKKERGVITSLNEHYVFVRYGTQHPTSPGQATNPGELEWETDRSQDDRL